MDITQTFKWCSHSTSKDVAVIAAIFRNVCTIIRKLTYQKKIVLTISIENYNRLWNTNTHLNEFPDQLFFRGN